MEILLGVIFLTFQLSFKKIIRAGKKFILQNYGYFKHFSSQDLRVYVKKHFLRYFFITFLLNTLLNPEMKNAKNTRNFAK